MKYLNMLYPWVATVALITWTISLVQYVRIFKQLYRTIDAMLAQLALINGMLAIRDTNPAFIMPSRCFSCGVVLQGGATQHKEGCEIRKMIAQHFSEVH